MGGGLDAAGQAVPADGRVVARPMTASWDPRAEADSLAALAQVAAAMHHGRRAFEERAVELRRGVPSRGTGGPHGNSELTPTEAGAIDDQRDDPEMTEWKRETSKALEWASRAWARYVRVAEPRTGIEKMADPGCTLCAAVPDHWCPVFGVRVLVGEPENKRARPKVQVLELCQWCYQMTWPSRMGRLPTPSEVTAHAEGRRVNWHGGAEPKLVEVPCPECRDENRSARRECKTCDHSGKVLKTT